MAAVKTPLGRPPSRTLYHAICIILLQFLVTFAQGRGPGDDIQNFSVGEELPRGTEVNTIPVQPGYSYTLPEKSPYFSVNSVSGLIQTAQVIDRDTLPKDLINLFVLGTKLGNPSLPIEVHIQVLDVNDNSPVFKEWSTSITFPENAKPGSSQHLIGTATDSDKGVNGTIDEYKIVDGNGDGKFKLVEPNSLTPLMYIEPLADLDRETKDFYQLKISARDQGTPPRYGYLTVNITISDVNDNPPNFNPSVYGAQVNESAPVGTSVSRVEATDIDKGLNAEIVYAIRDGGSDQFTIERKTGELKTLKRPLKCSRLCEGDEGCKPNSCLITVEAFDLGTPALYGRAYVTVNIIDENDHSPLVTFGYTPNASYDHSVVDENAKLGHLVATVTVTDKDTGENGKTTVKLTKGNELGHFILQSIFDLNRILVYKQLDRETVSRYNLTIEAVDHGYPPRRSTAFLIIFISDANDHAPQFEKLQYRVKKSELLLPGSFVASITAFDEDSGYNSALTYTIISGNTHNWFRIDSMTGLVTTLSLLDHEIMDQVVMNISATDGGATVFRNFTTLTVDIMDENDVVPTFERNVYEKDILENVKIGTTVMTVAAVDTDDGVNGTIAYMFHPSVQMQYPNIFALDQNGHITTLKLLDRETKPFYKILIIAKDGGSPSLSSTATINLRLLDVNDNAPRFYPQQYFGSVLENLPSGQQVVKISAVDPDDGINGKVTYSFFGNSFSRFSIDAVTGYITTTKELDHRDQRKYTLTVRATDGKGKVALTDASVEVTVANVNDVPPVFTAQKYSFSIPEDGDRTPVQSGRSVGEVKATSGSGGITYAIVGGDPMGVFKINRNTGRITTFQKVDREIQALYNLNVIASAGSRFRDTTVAIEITDVNDNTPKFVNTILEARVIENWPVNHNIYLAEAVDSDAGPNGNVSYSLNSDANNVFMIHSKTGVIYLNKPISQLPPGQSVSLTVIATDAGTPQLSTSMDVIIHIQDVNDHTPFFPRSRYEISLHESKLINEPIFQLLATDSDLGLNGMLVFNITRGNEQKKFGIFPDGTLYVAHRLDREVRDVYSLSVMVRDRGVEPRSSLANITIHILDDNDNKPVFSNITYDFYVRENMPFGTYIGTVKATDMDIGRNAELTYSLDEDQQNFSIDVQTGTIFTKRSFDRERLLQRSNRNYYTFDVTASDNGIHRLKNRVSVKVHVTDDNDNPPRFSQNKYSADVIENAQTNFLVKKVTATDSDTGANAAISYFISHGNEDKKFKVDETGGQVLLIGQLDREKHDTYSLTIVASDTGDMQLSATTTLDISVIDFNDNAPTFETVQREASVSESAQPGETIAKFIAFDLDLGNNAALVYIINSGNSDSTFNLDRHMGKLYLNKPLDYERQREYRLNIVVSDAGSPPLKSSLDFVVKVVDVNDNSPEFDDSPITIRIAESQLLNRKIGTVTANDRDAGDSGKILYSIAKQDPIGNNFQIDSHSGNLSLQSHVDREYADRFGVTVVATDQAHPPETRKSSRKIITVIVTDVNDNSPIFTSMDAFVVQSSSRGAIATISADDADIGENGRVTYELMSGDQSLFSLSSSGELSLRKTIPSSPFSYNLIVKARDHGNSVRSATMPCTIILSSLENGPIFSSLPYSGVVSENKPAGSSILVVQATPTRSGVQIRYYITGILSNVKAQGRYFTIDKSSGQLSTAIVLDREKIPEMFSVQIHAVELGGSVPRTRSTQAKVKVLDENDTPPQFTSSLFTDNVQENQNPGHRVLKVDAYDLDTVGTLQLQLNGVGAEDFSIASDGTVKTARKLHRERRRAYAFRVQASDGVQMSAANVQIGVLDVNDNKPVFSQSFYSIDVREDTASGTTVASVTATDSDEDANSQVTYDLVSDWGKDKFQLDSTLGTITLINMLDFEEVQLYTLKVVAKDGGNPPESSTATVYMNVKDVNDNTPVFDPMSYSQETWENASPGTKIVNVSATDVDSGRNGEVRYSLVDGDSQNQFSVGPESGTIFTVAKLDRETKPTYSLIVMATDQALPVSSRLSTTATVTIHLKDVNDCHPEFHSPNKTWVKENSPNSSVVFSVTAIDRDAGMNGQVGYRLAPVSRFGYPFIIDPLNGDLKVNSVLDRESVPDYLLEITATDKGQNPLSSTQKLQVYIKDVNDNAPKFLKDVYSTTVAEDIGVSGSLLKVSATDLDKGLNGLVRYYIIDGDDNYDFNMDMSSGVLRVQKMLDYERQKVYNLVVQAQDSGVTTVMASTAQIIINVTDVNDNQPVFVDSPYNAFVQENMVNLPVYIKKVHARDDDSEPNSQLEYSMLEDADVSMFSIDPHSGQIKAHQTFDREQVSEYVLTIFAKDSGNPLLRGTGTVRVFVQDVNDHAPVFENSGSYVGHVMEESRPFTDVLTMKATDKDEGVNAQIVYSLEDSKGTRFTIQPDSGLIVTTASLDREERDVYHLVVKATDRGIPPKSVTTQVTVFIDDVNDNTPEFERQNYSQNIHDPTETGEFVIGVTAVDRDIGSNGKVIYSLLGTDASRFSIDSKTGVITAGQKLSGAGARFHFQVKATDQGEKPHSNTVSVQIVVQSVSNRDKPVFGALDSNLQMKENSPTGMSLTTVTATTTASNQILYYIAGGNVNRGFSINQSNGTITVSGTIDYETSPVISLWVQASDGKNPLLSAFKKLPVSIVDVNDNTPRFEKSAYNTSIVENVAKGSTLKKVTASDADTGDNGKIIYSIASGNKNNTFRIDPNTGLITTNNIVDREGYDFYQLIIQASDMGSTKRLSSSATVSVYILDVNDNRPKFTHQFSVSIPENTPPFSFIIQITSTDKDLGDNAVATYQLLSEQSIFAIENVSGNLSTVVELDAENTQRYFPKVQAIDESFRVQTQVIVIVTDVNDNAPVFTGNSLSFDFQERLPPKSFVGKLSATDVDISKPNNQFIFSLKQPSVLFELDAESGNISSLVTMLYIHTADGPSPENRHTLQVVVTDLGSPAMSSETTVVITVIDANNHSPVFEEESYFSGVPVNADINSPVIQVFAKDDKDYGVNAEVYYVATSGNGTSLFKVGRGDGVISVSSSLNGLQNNDYFLILEARDKGVPQQSSSVTIQLAVTDVNNFSPVFTNTVFQKTFLENVDVGYTIDTLTATDADPGLNGQIQYFITAGDTDNSFSIGKTSGVLKVVKALDYDTVPVHLLNISARDKGLLFKENSVLYTINLSDVNDNPPVFNQTSYDAYVPENSPPSFSFYEMSATDADSGANAIIKFRIVGNGEGISLFSIDSQRGIMRVEGNLDYEKTTYYELSIMAFNEGRPDMKSVTTLKIHVTGVNEYYPKFEQKRYDFNVSESAALNKTVGEVKASDEDKGTDGIVYYFLIGSSNMKGFRIDHRTGVIHVAGRPDYESSPQIVLNVMAKNWGSIKGNDTDQCKVYISIDDANDPPTFTQNVYFASVFENSPANTDVIQVNATDNDVKPENQQFVYVIREGNVGNRFQIDRTSGLIKTTGQGDLDRETVPVYNLTIGAVDSGLPPQTGSATVRVQLGDINDNGPLFNPSDLKVYVRENLSANTPVTSLTQHTTDPDIPPNQDPYQYKLSGPMSSVFDISSNGEVKTKRVIDHEETPQFAVSVVVTDGGIPTQTSTLTFTVIVQDVNDNPPQPRPLTVSLMLLEGMSAAGVIADVRPLDRDIVGNYSCTLDQGDRSKFAIYEHCNLQVISESVHNAQLKIRGYDGITSHPAVSYEASVNVTRFQNTTVESSIAVILEGFKGDYFLEMKYSNFLSALQKVFGFQNTVMIYSFKDHHADLLVFFSVKKQNGDYLAKDSLEQTLKSSKTAVESAAGVKIKSPSYNTCRGDLCQNFGTCQSKVILKSGYNINNAPQFVFTSAIPELYNYCECLPSYTGRFCEIPLGPCGDTYCYNGGECVKGEGGKDVCHCPPQWKGPSCQDDVDECEQGSPCKQGGTCQNTNGSFHCKCPDGYHGDICENSYHCASKPCLHAGTCHDTATGYVCFCTFGRFGNNCERSSQGFEEGSYIIWDSITDLSSVDIVVHFATIKKNALLLLNHVKVDQSKLGFLALEIVEGLVRFSFKLDGSEYPKRLMVTRQVSDGQWYKTQVKKSKEGTVLKIQKCPEGSSSCEECIVGDSACYQYQPNDSGNHLLNGQLLVIGGVKNITELTQYDRDISSHDFIGCAHSFEVNGRNVLLTFGAKDHSGVTTSCPRGNAKGSCTPYWCANGGKCVDEWSSARCTCMKEFMGPQCKKDWQPFGFSSDAQVIYKLRDSYFRDQILAKGRQRRSIESSEVSLRFRTTESQGYMFYSATKDTKCLLWVQDGKVKFVLTSPGGVNDPLESPGGAITDGGWHNVTVKATGRNFVIELDGTPSAPKDFGESFDFSSIHVVEMALSGVRVIPSGIRIKGFNGCISEFHIDGAKLPFSGMTDRYKILVSGSVEEGCQALCDNNPCGDGKRCNVTGEEFTCAVIDTGGSGGLEIGVIVVIVFFALLIVAIVIVFIIFRKRRGLCQKVCAKKQKKTNANLGSGSLAESQEAHDSGYGDNGNFEEMIIRNHITDELMSQKTCSMNSRPDLIGSTRRSVLQPLEMDDGTVIIENGDPVQIQPLDDSIPEHYDLENASSIAPSDSDIVSHYRYYRDGKGPRFKTNPHIPQYQHKSHHPSYGKHGESPLALNGHGRPGSGLSRESPGALRLQGNGYRHSPVPGSINGSALSMPARNSPLAMNSVQRPGSAQAVMRQSPMHQNPHARTSPLAHMNMRTTPISNLHSSRSNSAHSLGSHHSHTSSSSSATHLPNSHLQQKAIKNAKKNRPVKGLTVEQINRLNARPDRNSPVSMLEAVSSSSDDRMHRKMKPEENITSSILLEPPESSSEDSGANDSFTCSEFEYENEGRTRNDFDPGMRIFSKLAEVENENDDVLHESKNIHSDGMDSNGDSFTSTMASSEDNALQNQKKADGTFNFDALLNWGPNFDKLVGVFKDIALLPDSETQTLEGSPGNDYEEYV